MSTTTVPTTITDEAAELIAELGLQAELERMLEQARQTIPRLQRLTVEYRHPYDTGIEPGVLINAYCIPPAESAADRTWQQYSYWIIDTFPPEVFSRFTLLLRDDTDHAG
jgi:hypothetical protein